MKNAKEKPAETFDWTKAGLVPSLKELSQNDMVFKRILAVAPERSGDKNQSKGFGHRRQSQSIAVQRNTVTQFTAGNHQVRYSVDIKFQYTFREY